MTQNQTLHLAAQYLATAAKSFVDPKEDDSHTNLAWNMDEKRLETRDLNAEGLRLALNYLEYSLDFIHPKSGLGASYPLGGARHHDVMNWISREAKFSGIDKEYVFDLDYDIPNLKDLTDDYRFLANDPDQMKELVQLRWLANKTIEMTLSKLHGATEIRVWPHHFDTGAIGYFDQSKKVSVGLGLAIPDSKVDDWYFYVSGYHGNDSIKTEGFKPLKNGDWLGGEWNGAILRASHKSLPKVSSFFNEALKSF